MADWFGSRVYGVDPFRRRHATGSDDEHELRTEEDPNPECDDCSLSGTCDRCRDTCMCGGPDGCPFAGENCPLSGISTRRLDDDDDDDDNRNNDDNGDDDPAADAPRDDIDVDDSSRHRVRTTSASFARALGLRRQTTLMAHARPTAVAANAFIAPKPRPRPLDPLTRLNVMSLRALDLRSWGQRPHVTTSLAMEWWLRGAAVVARRSPMRSDSPGNPVTPWPAVAAVHFMPPDLLLCVSQNGRLEVYDWAWWWCETPNDRTRRLRERAGAAAVDIDVRPLGARVGNAPRMTEFPKDCEGLDLGRKVDFVNWKPPQSADEAVVAVASRNSSDVWLLDLERCNGEPTSLWRLPSSVVATAWVSASLVVAATRQRTAGGSSLHAVDARVGVPVLQSRAFGSGMAGMGTFDWGALECVASSTDGQVLYTGNDAGDLHVWDTRALSRPFAELPVARVMHARSADRLPASHDSAVSAANSSLTSLSSSCSSSSSATTTPALAGRRSALVNISVSPRHDHLLGVQLRDGRVGAFDLLACRVHSVHSIATTGTAPPLEADVSAPSAPDHAASARQPVRGCWWPGTCGGRTRHHWWAHDTSLVCSWMDPGAASSRVRRETVSLNSVAPTALDAHPRHGVLAVGLADNTVALLASGS